MKGQDGEEAEVGGHGPPVGFLWRRTRVSDNQEGTQKQQLPRGGTGTRPAPKSSRTSGEHRHTHTFTHRRVENLKPTPSWTQEPKESPPRPSTRADTHLCLLQPPVHLPEVFGEELFADGLSVDPDSLPDLDQMRGTTRQGQRARIKGTGITSTPLVGGAALQV